MSRLSTFGCCAVLLLAGALWPQITAADSPSSEATPEATLSSEFGVFNAPGAPVDVSKDNENGFWHDLEVGDAPAAARIITDNIAPAVATGAEPFPSELISQLVSEAAMDLTTSTGATGNYANQEKPIDQQLYERTFDTFLSQLKGVSNTTITQGFAKAIYTTMNQATYSGNLTPDLIPSLFALAHSAGFDQAITAGFQVAQNNQGFQVQNLTVIDVGQALASLSSTLITIQPDLNLTAHLAALEVFGFSPANVDQAQGNISSIANYMFGSAYLALPSPAAAAQNLSSAILSSGLPSTAQNAALVQSINQTLREAQPAATGVLVAAALGANETAAVSQGFALAKTAPLQVLCAAQASAQAISNAAGQAASSAISPVFGADPCNLFQGPQGESFRFNRSSENKWEEFTDAQTVCTSTVYYEYDVVSPLKSDCLEAIAQIQANGSTACAKQVNPSDPSSIISPLAVAGTCRITLSGADGVCFPSSGVAQNVTSLANACENINLLTSGSLNIDPATESQPSYLSIASLTGF